MIMELRPCWNTQKEQKTPGHFTSWVAKVLDVGSSTHGGQQPGQPCSSPAFLLPRR